MKIINAMIYGTGKTWNRKSRQLLDEGYGISISGKIVETRKKYIARDKTSLTVLYKDRAQVIEQSN